MSLKDILCMETNLINSLQSMCQWEKKDFLILRELILMLEKEITLLNTYFLNPLVQIEPLNLKMLLA
jgi:hypothetical protein